ncbi:Putative exported protein precursor [hydrothermal vent metagenome]|uniref:Putative exported protein n=1 Tax=hydrothermal vent metagenome TaxID=652676 RepID=A0A1W1EE01_9ZZZZ
MKNIKKLSVAGLATVALSTALMAGGDIVPAETTAPVVEKSFWTPNFTYGNVSVNYLDWSSKTTKAKPNMSDFVYLEFEGGAGWDWGEFYFFTDIENPGHSWDTTTPGDNSRFVIKPILDVKIADSNWYIHIQDYYLNSDGFMVNNLVTGLAYKYSTDNFWIRPFIGPHFQQSRGFNSYDGFNGYMAGWTFVYNFKLGEQKFMLSNWQEFEFSRPEDFYALPYSDGRSHGINGAVAVWWTPIDAITTGVQYRYANYKLGMQGYSNAVIYSLKYNF